MFEILSTQSDCHLSEILFYHLGGLRFSSMFPLPGFTGLIACNILPGIEPIVTVWISQ